MDLETCSACGAWDLGLQLQAAEAQLANARAAIARALGNADPAAVEEPSDGDWHLRDADFKALAAVLSSAEPADREGSRDTDKSSSPTLEKGKA